MDKRLLQALFLSFLVLLGWQLTFAPKRPATPPEGVPASAPTSRAPDAAALAPHAADADGNANSSSQAPADASTAQGSAALRGPRIDEPAPREMELTVGTSGKKGSYHAVFSNRGASLVSLSLGDSVDRAGLDAAERLEREHWTGVLETLPGTPQAAVRASLALSTDASAREFESADLTQCLWQMREWAPPEGGAGVEFEYASGSGVRYSKRVRFVPDSYRIEVELALENQALERAGPAGFRFTPADVMPKEAHDAFYLEPQAVAAGRSKAPAERGARDLPEIHFQAAPNGAAKAGGPFDGVPSAASAFAGVHNKYFAVLLWADDASSQGALRGASWRARYDVRAEQEPAAKPQAGWRQLATDVHLELALPEKGATKSWRYNVYVGPKSREELLLANPDFEALLKKDLGYFSGIASVLLAVLRFFHGLVGNWGLAIILLTFTVRLLLFPINRRSQTAMARYQTKMKRLQPQIEELKQRYAKDPTKLRQEQGVLMQKEGAFPPLFGCLTMFVQIPVFFGLFSALRTSFDLRQAPFFGWMNDLSKPDRLAEINFDTHLPFVGTIQYLNVLPPLMVALWILQQALMPKPSDPQAARMQKMMMFMPAVMGLFLYNYAAGLSVYMITQSLLGIVELSVIKKYWPVDEKELAPKPGFMAKLMERAQEAQRLQRAGATARRTKR